MTTSNDVVEFGRDVQPLFRERDREAMRSIRGFDLWSYDDVRQNASAILAVLEAGRMPCDGAWPPEKVAVFRRWSEDGMAP